MVPRRIRSGALVAVARGDLVPSTVDTMNTGKLAVMAKRGYSREFTPKTERRVRFEVDRIPPTLFDAVKAKAKRQGVSLRNLTLTLWREWVERRDEA